MLNDGMSVNLSNVSCIKMEYQFCHICVWGLNKERCNGLSSGQGIAVIVEFCAQHVKIWTEIIFLFARK